MKEHSEYMMEKTTQSERGRKGNTPDPGQGEDPKSVLCAYFKVGQCTKGANCRYSHDLNISTRSSAKRSAFADDMGGEEGAEGDGDEKKAGMDDWTTAELEAVVNKKGNVKSKQQQLTKIICKHFLTALENRLYGWFWECPAGDACMYRHALPRGFILKTKDEILQEKLAGKELGPSADVVAEQKRAEMASREGWEGTPCVRPCLSRVVYLTDSIISF